MINTNLRPKTCCDMGTYECQISMPIKGRLQGIDICISDIVAALNAANIRTDASCCGHGIQNGSIILEDGRELVIKKFDPKNHIHTRYDKKGGVNLKSKI